MDSFKHQWTTGRDYDEHGQRMVAEMAGGELRFSDLSRHINGLIPTGDYLPALDKFSIKDLVMCNYDYGNYGYSSTTLTWEK